MSKVAVLLGSLRRPGSGIGIASWLTPLVRQGLCNAPCASTRSADVVFVDPTQPPLPLGPIVDGSHMPSDIRDPSKHPHPAVREWATFVAGCSGFVVLTPEYNGAYPGELKNTLDHLYWEWRNKPAVIVSYGGSGGVLSAGMLKTLLGSKLKMQVTERAVNIKLPRGTGHVDPEKPPPDWLRAYEPAVLEVMEDLGRLINKAH